MQIIQEHNWNIVYSLPKICFSPTAEGYGVAAQIGSFGVVWGSLVPDSFGWVPIPPGLGRREAELQG